MLLFSVIAADKIPVEDTRIAVPKLALSEMVPYATNRPVGRTGREQVDLPFGLGVAEIPFDGDIGVFDCRPTEAMALPLGETRGHYLRLLVPIGADGEPQPSAVKEAIARTQGCLAWLDNFWSGQS